MVPPNDCALTIPNQCQSSTNVPIHCPSSKFYQPPLPENITIDGKYYSKLEADDIDCSDDDWADGCAKEFCNRQSDGIKAASTVMSIPYIISACLSPLLGGFVDKFGMRAVISTIAPAALIVVHTLMAITNVDPIGTLSLSLSLPPFFHCPLLTRDTRRADGGSGISLFSLRCSYLAFCSHCLREEIHWVRLWSHHEYPKRRSRLLPSDCCSNLRELW
jgi:hypothetical protein